MLEHGIELALQQKSTWACRLREGKKQRPGSQSRHSILVPEPPSLVECAREPVEWTVAAEGSVEIDAVPGAELGKTAALEVDVGIVAAPGADVDKTALPGAEIAVETVVVPEVESAGKTVAPGVEVVVGTAVALEAETAGKIAVPGAEIAVGTAVAPAGADGRPLARLVFGNNHH